MDIKNNLKYKEIVTLRLSIENRLAKAKGAEDSLKQEIKLLRKNKLTNDGSPSKDLVKELQGKLTEAIIHRMKAEKAFDSMNKIVKTTVNNIIENIEPIFEIDSKINESLIRINSSSKISHKTKNEISDSVRSNIINININNQNHRIKQTLIRIAELANQIDKEYKEARLQPVSSQALSEQVAAFQPSQEGSSVIESLTEAPIRPHGFGKCGCGGLGRTAFC